VGKIPASRSRFFAAARKRPLGPSRRVGVADDSRMRPARSWPLLRNRDQVFPTLSMNSVSPVSVVRWRNLKPRLLTKGAEGIRVNHVTVGLLTAFRPPRRVPGVRFAEPDPRSQPTTSRCSDGFPGVRSDWSPGSRRGRVVLGMTRSNVCSARRIDRLSMPVPDRFA